MLVLRTTWTWDGHPVPDAEQVELRLGRLSAHLLQLTVDAPFHGDPPPDGPPGPTPQLWEHEVAELFVLGSADTYTEIELGPHGHHLVLRLEGRRHVVAQGLPLASTARIAAGRWFAHALVPRALLPTGPHRVNAAAIHGAGGERRYLTAQPLAGPAPDFHQLECFDPVELP